MVITLWKGRGRGGGEVKLNYGFVTVRLIIAHKIWPHPLMVVDMT